MRPLLLVILALTACHHEKYPVSPSPATPVARSAPRTLTAQQVAAVAADTTPDWWTAKLNPGNPIVELAGVVVRVKGKAIGYCLFAVAADSTGVSFPAVGMDCGPLYHNWWLRRQPGTH